MVKVPAGTTTISGQLSHSLKLSFGLSARSPSGTGHRGKQVIETGSRPGEQIPRGQAGCPTRSVIMQIPMIADSCSD
jgi:hypothetical protein